MNGDRPNDGYPPPTDAWRLMGALCFCKAECPLLTERVVQYRLELRALRDQ